MISFWSVLVFSSAFFRRFFRGTVCLSSFVLPGAFLAFFLGQIGGILLSPYVVAQLACVGPFVHAFSSFSVCLLRVLRSTTSRRTCFWLLRCRFRFGFRTRLPSLWPTLFISPNQLSLLGFVHRTSLPFFPVGLFPFPALFFLFPALLFQRCFPRCFQLCLGCCQLVFSSVAVDLEHQSFWMESFWSPESIVWLKLRTFLCGWKLILSTKQ